MLTSNQVITTRMSVYLAEVIFVTPNKVVHWNPIHTIAVIVRNVKTHCESKIVILSAVITIVVRIAIVIVGIRKYPISCDNDCDAYDLVSTVSK